MRSIILALKDLKQTLGDKKSLIFLVAMPLVFTVFMGFAFSGVGEEQDNRLPLGWIDNDPDGQLSQSLEQALDASDVVRLVSFAPDKLETAAEQARQGKLAGYLIIPAGYSAALQSGEPVQLVLFTDDASTTGQTVLQAVRVPVSRLMSAVAISRLSTAQVEALAPFKDDAARQQEQQTAFNAAAQAWSEAASSGLVVAPEKVQGQSEEKSPIEENPYSQTSPGILVQFAIFSLVTSAGILVQERKNGTLQRLVTTSMRRSEIIIGHLLAMFALVMLQEILLVVFGQLVLKVDYFAEPLGTLLVMTGLALWTAALGLFIGVIARQEEQVILFSLIAMFLFTSLGGGWFPLESSGETFALIGHFTPAAWAMDGFQNVFIRGLGFESTLLPSAILLGYAGLFFSLAVWRFRMD